MDNTQYVNSYIEIMTQTMTDAVVRNVSLQANLKLTESLIEQLQKSLDEVQEVSLTEIEQLKDVHAQQLSGMEQIVEEHQNRISELTAKLNDVETSRVEYENTKHQVQHIDTFKNELSREREENSRKSLEYQQVIKELQDRIEFLELPAAKRKKIEEAASKIKEDKPEDGGTF